MPVQARRPQLTSESRWQSKALASQREDRRAFDHSPDDTCRGQVRDRRLVSPELKVQQIRMIRHKRTQTEVRVWLHPFVSVCVVSPNLLVPAREALETSARGHRWKLESVYSSGAKQAISPACLAWLSQVYCETWPEIFTSQPEFFRESPQQREAYL
jgi:hypothetical protein